MWNNLHTKKILNSVFFSSSEHARFLQPLAIQMRAQAPGGQPMILAPRLPPPQSMVAVSQPMSIGNGAPPPLVSPPGEAPGGLMYNPYTVSAMPSPMSSVMDPYGLGSASQPSIFEYQTQLDQTQAGMLFRRDCVTGM